MACTSGGGLMLSEQMNNWNWGISIFFCPCPSCTRRYPKHMAVLGLKANSAMKAKNRGSSRGRGRGRVLPLFGDLERPEPEMKSDALLWEEDEVPPKLNLEDDPELLMALAQLRLKAGKSWKPKLDTIEEFRPKLRDLLQWNVEQHENY